MPRQSNFRFFTEIVLIFAVTILVFYLGIDYNNTHVDINQLHKTTGNVHSTFYERNKQGFNTLIVKVINDKTAYYIYQPSQHYQYIEKALKANTPVTIYYGYSKRKVYSTEINQIQSGRKMIYSKTDFEDTRKAGARYFLIPISFIYWGWLIYKIRKRFWKPKVAVT